MTSENHGGVDNKMRNGTGLTLGIFGMGLLFWVVECIGGGVYCVWF